MANKYPKSERDARRVLTEQQVADARAAYAAGEDARSIARRLGVSSNTMYGAIVGKTWKNLPGACAQTPKPGLAAKHRVEASTWRSMVNRCHNQACPSYGRYGARGVTVCDRWRESFAAFLADVGDRPGPDYSIDRIDGSRGYEPGNVRWATLQEQATNKRSNRIVEAFGKSRCIADWSRETGIAKHVIKHRLDVGWTAEDALSIPVGAIKTNKKRAA